MLSKHLISSVLTQVPVFIFGVLSGVFSTRILGDDAKGIFSLFQANSQLFVLVFSLGIQTGIVYFISSKKISESLVIGMAITVFSITSVLLAAGLVISYFFGWSELFLPETYSNLTYIGLLFLLFLFSLINSSFGALFQSRSDFKTINSIAITNSIINVIIFSILFFGFKSMFITAGSRLNIVLYLTIAVLFINSLFWFVQYKKKIRVAPAYTFSIKDHLKPFLSYNSSVYLGMFINFFNYRLDLWIVNHYLNENELSYYSLAANINQIILYIAVTIASVMLPNFSGKNEEERLSTFIKISRICFAFFAILIIVAYLSSSFIIPLMYGKSFESTILPFQILLPGILFSCITQLFSIFIVSINKNFYNITACACGLIITLILDLILIPRHGINGAAIATTISYFLIFMITYIFVSIETKKTTYNFFIPRLDSLKFVLHLLKNKQQ